MIYSIYTAAGVKRTDFDGNSNSTHDHKVQTNNELSLSFTLQDYVVLEVNDYIDIGNMRFILMKPYKPVMKSTKEYAYDVKFYGPENIAGAAIFLDSDYNPISSYYDTPSAQLAFIVSCINRAAGDTHYHVGEVISSEPINVEYTRGCTCLEALSTLSKACNTEWWLDGVNFNLSKCEHGEPVTLAYDRGLLNLTKEIADTDEFFTRLLPTGSTKNIVASKYGHTTLQLPDGKKWIDRNVNLYGIKEKWEEDAFADIFPRFTGTVGTVRTEVQTIDGSEVTVYYFKAPGIPFNPNDYSIANTVKHVVFKSGDLLGQDFEANWHEDTGEWELITQYPTENSQLPGDNIIPRTGDTYTVYNLDMPSEYYPLAEQEYEDAVNALLDNAAIDFATYKAPTDHVYLEDNEIALTLGRRVRLENDIYFPEGYRDSRITRIVRKLSDLNDMDIEVSNTIIQGQYATLKSDVADLKNTFAQTLANEILNVLRTNSSADLTDENVLSSLRTLKEIKNRALSRLNDDEAAGIIKFLKGWITKNYTSGLLGTGAGLTIDPITGKTRIEADELFIRMKAYFYELVIETLTHVGGQIILTPARMTCIKVEDLTNAYRCYFKATDGEKTITNDFIVGDQAATREFNIKAGTTTGATNHYFWRLVTGIGDDYIDLSKTDCDTNSDAPLAGDDISQLGNRTDAGRMNAIILSSFGTDAPSLKQYAYIDSYSLVDKEVTVISKDGNRFIGDFILKTGINIATQMQILENFIKTEIQSVEYTINANDNYLSNASFTKDMENWQRDSDIEVFANDDPLVTNDEYYADADKIADVMTHDGKLWLRLKNSYVKQLNGDITQPVKAGTFYVSLRYVCVGTGTLTCGFSGQELYKIAPFALNPNPRMFEFSGNWDGTGDFLIQFTGDIYINLVALTNKPLDDFKTEVNTKFQQTSDSLTAIATSINNISRTIAESGWLTTANGTEIWAACTFPDGTKAISLFEVRSNGIFIKGSTIDLTGLVTFESFSDDALNAYIQDLNNAALTAKNDVATQLGFSNYADLVTNAAQGKAILVGGYLNIELIDVSTLIAKTVSTPFLNLPTTGDTYELNFNNGFHYAGEREPANPLTVLLPIDIKYNGVNASVYNRGVTLTTYDVITIQTNSGADLFVQKMDDNSLARINIIKLSRGSLVEFRAINPKYAATSPPITRVEWYITSYGGVISTDANDNVILTI